MKRILIFTLCTGLVLALGCETKEVDSDCIGKATGNACHDVYDPVCGCNGVTYGNSCYATSAGVKKFTSGTCK